MYTKIENFSKKSKVSKFLYRMLFRNVPDTVMVTSKNNEDLIAFKGKHIRNINITSFDPLGYTKNAIEGDDEKWYENFGNRLHVKSKNFAIRSYLLFKKGDVFNEQKLYESERLLRNTRFINRVKIIPVPTEYQDSLDVNVRVIDSWSLKPLANYSGNKFGIGLTESNFMGMGHEVSLQYRTNFKTRKNYSIAKYTANNIVGTYINAEFLGENDFDNNENIFIRGNREFFSPLTKWGGGINIQYFKRNIPIPLSPEINPDLFPKALVKVHNEDFWAGYQFQLGHKKNNEITDNLGVTARFQNYNYMDSPDRTIDPYDFFRSFNLYLAAIHYTQRKFRIVKNVFQYQLPEDIPYGKSVSFTGGIRKDRTGTSYPYAGISLGWGGFTTYGYFNYKLQYGSFFKEEKNYRSTLRFDGTFFSPLHDWKFAQVRHFISHSLVIGNSRNPSYSDRINISALDEFPSYNPNYLGRDKLILRYQSQFFVKNSWKNFQFNPYYTVALGWLSNDKQSLFRSTLNTKIGVGVLIYNPYIAFRQFQISLVYYPKLPFDMGDAWEVNSYRNHYLPFNNFNVERPSIVNYNY